MTVRGFGLLPTSLQNLVIRFLIILAPLASSLQGKRTRRSFPQARFARPGTMASEHP
jgi:hypothetical protein